MTREMFNEIIMQCAGSKNIKHIHSYATQVASSANPYYICDFAEMVSLSREIPIIRVLEEGMIKTGDLNHIYEFMFLMVDLAYSNFDLKRFETIIRESKDPKLMHYSLLYVSGIDTEKMLEALYETKCLKHIEAITEEYDVPSEKIDAAKNHKYFPECLNIYYDGTQICDAELFEIFRRVLYSENPYHINAFTEYFGHLEELGINFEALQKVMIHACFNPEVEEPLHLYEFAASVPKSNKSHLEDSILQIGVVKYMYYMYAYVDGCNKEAMQRGIMDSMNEHYISKLDTSPSEMGTIFLT